MFHPGEWGRPLTPDDRRRKHIVEFLGLGPGDSLRCGLMGTGVGTARIIGNPRSPGNLELDFPSIDTLIRKTGRDITIIIGHPRPPVFQRLLKDLCSMGIAKIFWVKSELTEKSYLASKVWNDTAIERQIILGLEQGGMSRPPRIGKYYSLHRCLQDICGEDHGPGIVLHAQTGAPGLPDALEPSGSGPVVLAVGPERGWTAAEVEEMAACGFTVAGLGPAILRSENAAVLAVGLANMRVPTP